MNCIQKKVLSGLIIICAVLVLGACSPEPDKTVPTEVMVITNIPANVLRTEKNSNDTVGRPTFKVYVQLSAGMTASAGYAAMGDVIVSPAEGSTVTATITNFIGPDGNPWKGVNWANQCVVISPQTVDDIFDIDAKAGMSGPTASSTVVLDWNMMFPKTFIKEEDYKKLYGKKGETAWGVIVEDSDIGGAKVDPPDVLDWETHFR